jgi:hypothetical protein
MSKMMFLVVVEECDDDLEALLIENGDGAEFINDVLYGVGINPTVYNITKESEDE